jgi:hypothetical protein
MNETDFAVEDVLARWKASLDPRLDLGGLFARNPVAHKWKAPFRSLLLRETVFWRLHDLLSQSYALYQAGHILGARILLRSGFETLAVLIYLNQLTAKVLEGTLDFRAFGAKTSQLLLGSKDESTLHAAINIVTVLGHCDRRYPGIVGLYSGLSESAHPNYEGLCVGYSRIDRDNDVTHFENRWAELYGRRHVAGMRGCIVLFEAEYNEVWPAHFDELEQWIEQNDVRLEATKDDAP